MMTTPQFEPGQLYTHYELQDAIGGNHQFYLPLKEGRILCGRIDPKRNASAPDVVFVGTKPKNMELAAMFAGQSEPVPVFLKRAVNQWEYVGEFAVDRYVTDPATVKLYAAEAQREITGVLLLKRVISIRPSRS